MKQLEICALFFFEAQCYKFSLTSPLCPRHVQI